MATRQTRWVREYEKALEKRQRSLKNPRAKPQKRKKYSERAPLTSDQQGLAQRYMPLARSLCKPLKDGWPTEADEFESAAMGALVEAAQVYNPAKNVKFATFARIRIIGALRDVQRDLIAAGWRGDMDHAPCMVSLEPAHEEMGRVLGGEPERPVADEVAENDAIEHWLRKLPRQYAAACRQIYVNRRSLSEAGAALGYSRSRIAYLHRESLAMLSENLELRKPARAHDAEPFADEVNDLECFEDRVAEND